MSSNPAAIVGVLIERWLDQHFDLMDACDFPELMVKYGFAERTTYDPDKHGPSDDVEPGDEWFALTDAGKAALAESRS